jgi:hypothetical protein
MPWYTFTPCCSKDGNPKDENQYTLYGNHPPHCEGYLMVCAIQAMDHHKKPIITCDLEAEICCALENQTSTTNVLLKGSKCDHDCD